MFTGVRFNGKHSYDDYGLFLRKRPNIGSPTAKKILVEIPGADGNLDLTEAVAGEVKYSNRTLEFEFGAMVERDYQADFKSLIMDDLHGQIMDIVLDEDPDWVYHGRVFVEFEDVYSWRLNVTITVDADPYKLAVDETTIEFSSTDIDDYIEIEPAKNSYSAKPTDHPVAQHIANLHYYNSLFEFGGEDQPNGDFSLYDIIRVRWTNDSPRGDSSLNPIITFTDAQGNTAVYYPPFLNNSLQVTSGGLTGEGLVITQIVSVYVQYVGGCTMAAVVRYGKAYTFQNERMSICPTWEVSSSNAVPVLINSKRFGLSPGATRNPEILLTKGDNQILFYWGENSPLRTVRMIARKGRL